MLKLQLYARKYKNKPNVQKYGMRGPKTQPSGFLLNHLAAKLAHCHVLYNIIYITYTL